MLKKIMIWCALLIVTGYLAVAFAMFCNKPDDLVCSGVNCVIEDSLQSAFIHPDEVVSILRRHGLYPKGKKFSAVHTRKMEECLSRDSRVERAECYKSPSGEVCVDILQRVPILHVLSDSNENYFVDSKGLVMPHGNCVAYLPLVTGHVDKAMACKELYRLGQLLARDKFWDAAIQQIHVTAGKELELVPRVGDHVVFLGGPEEYEQKLARLKMFYEKALNKVGWNKYARISLEFSNQIICTKKEK